MVSKIIIFISFLTILTFTFCSSNIDSKNQVELKDSVIGNCEINILSNSFSDELFPFEFQNFNSSQLLKYFSKNCKVDSLEMIGYENYRYRLYTFSNQNSSIEFFVKSYDTTETWYYLEKAEINSDLLYFNKNLKIGMQKTDFIKNMKLETFHCDTLEINADDDLNTTYHFIFENNALKKLNIYGYGD